ncbi:PHP domain-containing protein, partial [Candidatus Azambacteria bacterium]|nr:PHP domain-containing protein [Candidatus Azambacteria bacterium]
MNSKQFESLHTHTTLSDGQFTHLEVLNLAQKYKIGTVAFTDHDILPDKKILRILEQNRDHQTKWIIGCELTSALPKELDKKSGGHHLHILGLFLDPYNKDLNLYCQNLLESRVVRMKKMINYLKDLGFAISFEACRKISQGAVARPHLVEALRLKEKNSKIIDLWVEKIIKKSEHDASAKKIYDKLLKQEKINCVYEFLNANAYAQEEDKKNSALLDLDGAVSLIRGAGGIAS